MSNASSFHNLLLALVFCLCGVSAAQANRERPRSVEEMLAASALVLDGEVVDVRLKDTTEYPHPNGKPVVAENYEARFKVMKIVKGEAQGEILQLVYSSITDARFSGDSAPLLKAGDRFRLFADQMEPQPGPLAVIRIRGINAVRPEAFDAFPSVRDRDDEGQLSPTDGDERTIHPSASNHQVTSSAGKEHGQEPGDSWYMKLLIVVVITAAAEFLWLLLRKRR